MAKKLLKPKRGKVENLSKLAVEDGALVFAYDTKATTSTVLVDIDDTRYDLAAGAAKKADNADALGGSSLQNIVDKINNSTGDGTAFTGLDTTTNNKVKLTRANGGTVEKTINNVSNASTADYAKNAHPIKNSRDYVRVANSYYVNQSSTITANDLAKMQYAQGMIYAATGNPLGKAGWVHIQNMAWQDGVDNWVSQLAFDVSGQGAYYRSSINSGAVAERSWNKFLDSANYTSYAAKKNAYNSASVSNATIALGRSDGSTGTTLTVNNVAHATSADLAKNSNALGGSSLKNITDKINSSIAANDAMHYMGTLGATAQKPTITTLPTTARTGDAYKVITAGTYSSIAAEVGDLFIYSGSWTLIPSGDDGNVYVGDSKSSKFAAKSNNIVVAVGDQKVASAANVTANAGTISALQSTMTQLKANQGTVTTLNGNKATFSTLVGRLKGDSDAAYFVRSTDTRAINTLPSTYATYGMGSKEEFKKSTAIGLAGADTYSHVITHIPWTDSSGGRPFQVAYSGTKIFARGSASDSAWSEWHKIITGADALASSASAISSTNNYFTAGATTAYVAAKTKDAVGNYLPLSGGTLTGDLTVNTKVTINGRGLQLNRKKGSRHGEINWWDPSYVTWINYMSDRTAGTAPTGGTPSTYGSVTSWAQRSLIENASGYGWIWESAANTTVASSVAPTPIMSLSSKEGNLTIRGNIVPGGQIVKGGASVSWLEGHKGTGVLINQNTYTGYNPLFRVKTEGGAWTFGPYSNNILYLNYATDAIINGTQNTSTKQITINPSGDVDGLGKVTASTVKAYLNGVASTAIVAAYPQGFESRTTSATWGNTTGTFITGWHTASGGDVAFMNDNPSNGKVSMKLDGYFYQNEGSKRVLDTDDIANIVQEANKVISITKSITLKTDWQDTGIEGTDLETGTYIVQISGIEDNSTPGIYGEIWSGIFSWYSRLTNSTNAEEILLHNAGHADNSNEIYLRTIRQGREIGKLKLQIAAKQAGKSAANVVFKFRKMI